MCSNCNRRHDRDRRPDEKYMLEAYGLGVMAELDMQRASLQKVTDAQLIELLNGYRAMA